ncbi:GH116 family glycosyl-hydrolase [Actinopolymorpha pittospori]|uniref:Uncharacterized protein (DUF608 family) n=1 Tax=Actinopolymorpha pittospori TaxID=648752 RepID=A0A927MVI1_9ACTN|nr:GH116 family glycosyl-hydrolase [Actinopolymorpha pittospori]MBE1607004.1 uncharacterized protein (DUF608 family) [Actinopolymorpha pittospori]
MSRREWPVLRTYDADHLDRISLPLGGIGTGTIGLGGRGDLRDFEVGNRPAKGFRPAVCMAALRTQSSAGVQTRVLEGPLPDWAFEGWRGATAANHGLPRFAHPSFDGSYPLGRVRLDDDSSPVSVSVEGFNPMVPGDLDASSWPTVVLRYRLVNKTAVRVNASVALSLSNFVGSDGTHDQTGDNRNTMVTAPGVTGIRMEAPTLDARAEPAGEFVLAVLGEDAAEVSARTAWSSASWGGGLLDFWDDLTSDGRLDDRSGTDRRPVGSLCRSVDLAPRSEGEVVFILAWRFPNRRAWRSEDHGIDVAEYAEEIVGNHYAEVFGSPWETVQRFADHLDALEARTVRAVGALAASSVPAEIKEAAIFNLSTLRSQTVFRTADGRFYGWEGLTDRTGSCFGSCSHVWGYEFATGFWFPEISRSMRETQFGLCTDDRGHMSFRVGLPIEKARTWKIAAADGQMATLVHLYNDWRLCGDDEWLRRLWPSARKAMEFCWIEGGWDADADGVMEGCQHNTMDVEYYGPNPQMGSWYLAALRACAVMAEALGEPDFAARCTALADAGSKWLDAHLFNGSFYRHLVRPVEEDGLIAEGLRHPSMGSASVEDPDLQLADGCLVDQLVGQYASRTVGLGALLDGEHVATTLESIWRRNFHRDLSGHFNNMRSYALADEAATLMCSYDEGNRPARPFPYFNEAMTGFEYTAATSMIFDGDRSQGLELIRAVRDRYRGNRRNPYDEAECGFHYARAMASWSAFVAWTGFGWDATTGALSVDLGRTDASTFWTVGSGWGTWTQTIEGDHLVGRVTVEEGDVALRSMAVAGITVPVSLREGSAEVRLDLPA